MNRVARNLLYPFAAVLISVSLVMAFHNTLVRWIALRAVQQVPGIEVQFEGPFDVTHIVPLTLDATGVDLTFTGDKLTDTRSRFGTVHLEMRLWPLLRGMVHIERLLIADADIEIPPAGTSGTPEPAPSTVRLPFIEELRLERVHVRIGRAGGRSPHELTIASLSLGEGEDGIMTATGAANLDGHGLALSANLGSLQELLHPTAPYPIDATLQAPSWDLEAHVAGTLGEPLEGRSARLHMRATTSDMSTLRDVFFPGVPVVGSVDAEAHLGGDLDAPTLSDVSLTIADEDRLKVTLSGSIADLQRMEGMDLQVDAVSQDPTVSRYVTQETLPSLQSIRLQTTVRGKANDYLLQDLDVEVTGRNKLSANARGSLRLTDLKSQWPIKNARLELQLSAATAELAAWLPQEMTRTGTLRLQAHLEGSAESLTFNDLELELDNTQPLRGRIDGSFTVTVAQLEAMRTGSESSAEVWIPAGVDVLIDLATADLQSLAPLLGQALPDLGALSAKAQLHRDGNAVRITQLDVQTTGKRPLHLSTEGQLTLAGMTTNLGMIEVDLRLTAKGPDAQSVVSLIGPLPIDPGHWTLKAHIKGKTGALRAEAIKFKSATDDSVHAQVEGSISDLEQLIDSAGKTPTGVMLKGQVTAASTQQLGAFIGKPLPNLGRFDARFDARGDKATWSIPNASIAITHTAGFDLKATGKGSDLLHDAHFDANLELQVPDPQRAAAGMGGSLPRLPSMSADGHIQGSQKQARFDGRIDVGTMPLKTALDAEFTGPRPHLSGTLSTPVLQLSDFLNPEVLSNASSDKPGTSGGPTAVAQAEYKLIFSNKPLGFEHLHHADIDLKLIADNIEGERIRTERFELTVEVENGRLKAHHPTLKHEDKVEHSGGTFSIAVEADSTTDPPRLTYRGRADNLSLGALYAEVSAQPQLTEGLFSFDIDLTGSGHSLHAVVATANGHYGHVLENAKLAGGDLDTLNLGLLRLVMASAVAKDHTDVDCDITKFRVNNGLAVSETLYLRTPKVVAAGTGHLNFSDESLDLVINTNTKRLLLGKKAVMRIHGPIRKPLVDIDLKDAEVTFGLEAAAIGATSVALPPLGFTMAALDTLEEFITDGEQQPCVSGDLSKK